MASRTNLTAAAYLSQSLSTKENVPHPITIDRGSINDPLHHNINQSPAGNVNQSPIGDVNQPPIGDVNQSPIGDVNQSPIGDVNRSPVDNINQSPVGNIVQSPGGIGVQSPVDNVNQFPIGNINQFPIGNINQFPIGNINQSPVANIIQSPIGTVNQSPVGNVVQSPVGNAIQSPIGNANQPTSVNIDRLIHGRDGRLALGDDDPAEIHPESASLGDLSLHEQRSTTPEIKMPAHDPHSESLLDDTQVPDLPIDDMIAEEDILDIRDSLDDSSIAPEGVKEYVLPSTTYNILVLGETQSGKSTLIESLRQYANPEYVINTRKIGDGTFSRTNDVRIERITSNLPTRYIFKAEDKTQQLVDHKAFIKEDQEDYEDELNDSRTYQLATKQSDLPNAYYNLIDTPGLNNTGSNEKSTLEYILKRIGNISALNLVLVTVSNNPFTQDLKDDLKKYFKLLEDFKGHLIFVHTKIDYAKLHAEDEQFKQLLEEKNGILHGLLGQVAPHIMIDNDLGSKKVVRNCITQNVLRDLLDRARTNEAVPLPAKYRYKPPVYSTKNHLPGYLSEPYSPFGAAMGRQGQMAIGTLFFDTRNAVLLVYITNTLAANGHPPEWAYHPAIFAKFERKIQARCPRQRLCQV